MLKPKSYYKKIVTEIFEIATSKEEAINHLLNSMGIPASIIGYEYIKQSVLILLDDPCFYNRNIVKEIYPQVAKICKAKSSSRVERGIRYAISYIFENNKITDEEKGVCLFVFNKSEELFRVSNSTFLFTLTRFAKEYTE